MSLKRKKYLEPGDGSDKDIPRTTIWRLAPLETGYQNESSNVTNSTSQSDKEEEWVDPVIVYDDHFVSNKEEEYFMDAIIDQKTTSKPDKEEELNYIDFLFDEGYNMQSKAEELMDSSENQQDDFNETQDDVNETHDDFETLFKRELSNCTTTTVGEVLIMILSLALKHSLTWVAVLDIISMINIIFNFDIIPKTKYFIKKIFSSGNSVLYHIYCPKCKALIGKKETLKNEELCVCGHIIFKKTVSSYFITFNLKEQFKELLRDPSLMKALMENPTRGCRGEKLSDIHDGAMYRRLCKHGQILSNKNNFSYTFNTDGCQLGEATKTSMWPIYVMINELPISKRHSNMLLAGIWVAKEEPNMKVFLQPFVDEANDLSETGVVCTYEGDTVKCKFIPICCSVDSVARPSMLNMTQFNGYFGCTFCYHPGAMLNGSMKYPMSEEIYPDRTDAEVRNDMKISFELNKSTHGVKGPSPLMNLKHFDLVSGMVPDYMHSVLLGVTKQLTNLYLGSPNMDYYVGSPTNVALIDERLLQIAPPASIGRTPRSVKERKMWKASEWRSWLVLYSLICLKGILPQRYYNHLALLVAAISIYLQDCITFKEGNNANKLLTTFVFNWQQLYGKSTMTFNVHLLTHLGKSVFHWGPLWAHSAFPFENANRLLLLLKKSPINVGQQIYNRIDIFRSLRKFEESCHTSERVKLFRDHVINVKSICSGTVLFGKYERFTFENKLQHQLNKYLDHSSQCTLYDRIIVDGIRYNTKTYSEKLKRCDSIVETNLGVVGEITKICKFDCGVILMCILTFENMQPFSDINEKTITHIKICDMKNRSETIIHPKEISNKKIAITLVDKTYIVDVLKGCTGNL